jgi:hypothetical protein
VSFSGPAGRLHVQATLQRGASDGDPAVYLETLVPTPFLRVQPAAPLTMPV